ncbi:MAG: chalcone synthase [Planctomycetaceae bacterium]|nr:chalcone synthase [Planctomycetaceae bacterium]
MKSVMAEIGTAVPQLRGSQVEIVELSKAISTFGGKSDRFLNGIHARSGVDFRHSVLFDTPSAPIMSRQSFYASAEDENDRGPTTAERMRSYKQHASALAIQSSAAALASNQLAANEIDHLVTVSCTGFAAPGVDLSIIQALELPPSVTRTNIGFMGCHAALNALRVGSSLVESKGGNVLVSATELCSLHLQYGAEGDQAIANLLFADGSAAVVLRQKSAAANSAWPIRSSSSTAIPNTSEHMSWRIGDHGFEMTLSASVPSIIYESVLPWLQDWLGQHNLTPKDIESWAIHPGGPKVISAFAEAVGLDDAKTEASRDVLRQYGNMSSPTVLFVVDRLRATGAKLPCVAIAFGPGLAIEATLFA